MSVITKTTMKKSLLGDQRGIAHPVLALVLIIVIGGVGFAGWRVLHEDNQDKAISKTATSSTDSSCLNVYHDQVLCNFAVNNANFSKLAFTAVDNSTNTQGQTTQVTIKGDGHGNSSISSVSGNQTTNSILIGSTTYIQNGSSWIKYTTKTPAISNPSTNLKLQFSSTATPKDKQVKYKNLGKEQCGDATCNKYQVSGPTTSGTTYIWINTSNDRLQRMTITSKGNGTDDITVTYGQVTITAPSPTTTPAAAANVTYQSEVQSAEQNDQ